MSPVDTDDWVLGAWMDWKPSKNHEVCESCGGKGVVGGGFKCMDGPTTCSTCWESGITEFHPKTQKPEVPKALVEHMHRAWKGFWEVDSLFKEEHE